MTRPVMEERACAWSLLTLPRRGTKYSMVKPYSAIQAMKGSIRRASKPPASATMAKK
ncbi:hypothetical protein D3C72_2284440 [compost metagenome]